MNTVRWSLSKYAKWEAGEWIVIHSEFTKKLTLILQELQLVVTHGLTVLESLSLVQSEQYLRSIYDKGVLVVYSKHQDCCRRKFRVQFASHLEGEECVIQLRRYIDVAVFKGSRPVVDKKQEPLSSVLARILRSSRQPLSCPESIPEEYPLEAAVQLAILDPGFPALVQRVEAIIRKEKAAATPNKLKRSNI